QLFDFCITFDSEVRWTWGRKWEIMRIAFVISRYLPIASVAMYLYLLLVARTYAFCGGEKRILIAISSFGMVTLVL
ncbi:hypothetical protein C8R48DRAFT_545045, partial [Suillus tomentosus]